MLRTLALLLLLANLGLWAYTQGHLAPLGLAPFEAREPERLAQQVAPQTLRVLNAPVPAKPSAAAPALPEPAEAVAAGLGPLAAEAAPAAASAPAPRLETEPAAPTPEAAPEAPRPGLATATAPPGTGPGPATACWLARGLSGPQAALVRAALEPKADLQGRWNLAETRLPPRWLVYIGPMASERALQQRRAELTLAEIEHRSVAAPLAPGLALGTFSSRERAEVALAQARREGVRDARVLQERPETISHTLVLSAVSAAQLRQIEAMAILPPRVLQACP